MRSVVALDHVQLAMPVDGEEAADAFYAGLLGFEVEAKPPALAGRGGRWYVSGPVRLHLGVETDFRAARKAHPALAVADLDDLVSRLGAAGAGFRVDTEVPGVRRGFVDDPFGNRIELIQAG